MSCSACSRQALSLFVQACVNVHSRRPVKIPRTLSRSVATSSSQLHQPSRQQRQNLSTAVQPPSDDYYVPFDINDLSLKSSSASSRSTEETGDSQHRLPTPFSPPPPPSITNPSSRTVSASSVGGEPVEDVDEPSIEILGDSTSAPALAEKLDNVETDAAREEQRRLRRLEKKNAKRRASAEARKEQEETLFASKIQQMAQTLSKPEKAESSPSKSTFKPAKDIPQWQVQKHIWKEKLEGQRWDPKKKLSPDAMEGIRAMHAQYPDHFTTPVLAEHFEVSAEAIRRILKSKWRPSAEEEEKRRERWDKRGERIWTDLVERGVHPPKRWREMGIGAGPRSRAQKAALQARIERRDGQGSQDGQPIRPQSPWIKSLPQRLA